MYDKPYITTRSEPKLRECVLKSWNDKKNSIALTLFFGMYIYIYIYIVDYYILEYHILANTVYGYPMNILGYNRPPPPNTCTQFWEFIHAHNSADAKAIGSRETRIKSISSEPGSWDARY
jgi:hypothetical protein